MFDPDGDHAAADSTRSLDTGSSVNRAPLVGS
jgi:hypothetical protein